MIPDSTAAELIDDLTKRTGSGTWLALVYAEPAPTDTLATIQECAVAGYSRKAVTWTAPSGSPPISQNSADIVFSFTADAPQGIVGAVLVDAASGTTGSIRKYYDASDVVSPKSGDTYTVAAGALVQAAQ